MGGEWSTLLVFPSFQNLELQTGWTNVLGLRANETAFPELLQTMRGPTKDARYGERRREQFGWQSEPMKQQRGVKLHIRIDAATRFLLR